MKATNEARLEDAERIYTEAVTIDPRNKGTNANLLADRAEVYFRMKRIDDCIKDCEASLALDQVSLRINNGVYHETFFAGLLGSHAAACTMSHGDEGVGGSGQNL